MPGGGVYDVRPARYGAGPGLQRDGARGEHELQVPGAGDGRGGEPERVLERGERDDAGAGHAGADGAEQSDGHRGEWPDQSELDRVDGRRGGDGVPGGAVPGGGVYDVRPARYGAGPDVQ